MVIHSRLKTFQTPTKCLWPCLPHRVDHLSTQIHLSAIKCCSSAAFISKYTVSFLFFCHDAALKTVSFTIRTLWESCLLTFTEVCLNSIPGSNLCNFYRSLFFWWWLLYAMLQEVKRLIERLFSSCVAAVKMSYVTFPEFLWVSLN